MSGQMFKVSIELPVEFKDPMRGIGEMFGTSTMKEICEVMVGKCVEAYLAALLELDEVMGE